MNKNQLINRIGALIAAIMMTAAVDGFAQEGKSRVRRDDDNRAHRGDQPRGESAHRARPSHDQDRYRHNDSGVRRVYRSPSRNYNHPGQGSVRYGERHSGKRYVRDHSYPRRIIREGKSIDLRVRTYPRWGTRIRHLPHNHTPIIISGRRYYRHDDSFYLEISTGPRVEFVLSRPPIGVEVSYIPDDYEIVVVDGREFIYSDDVYYDVIFINGQPVYRVIDPPFGATIVHLPERHDVVYVRGQRYYRVADRYYEACSSGPSLVYRRVRIEPY
jgi:hypothetical protein